jgi:hypothetical protein
MENVVADEASVKDFAGNRETFENSSGRRHWQSRSLPLSSSLNHLLLTCDGPVDAQSRVSRAFAFLASNL